MNVGMVFFYNYVNCECCKSFMKLEFLVLWLIVFWIVIMMVMSVVCVLLELILLGDFDIVLVWNVLYIIKLFLGKF